MGVGSVRYLDQGARSSWILGSDRGKEPLWGKLPLAKVWRQLSNSRRLCLSEIILFSGLFATFARVRPQSEIHLVLDTI